MIKKKYESLVNSHSDKLNIIFLILFVFCIDVSSDFYLYAT
jgi:hypothetical protein